MGIDERIASSCLARHVCRQHMLMCSSACPWHIDMRYQIALSGIPDEYRGITVETLDDNRENLDDLRQFAAVAAVRKPKNGLFLTSATSGNGKSEAACAIAQSYIVARTKKAIVAGTSLDQLVQFVNTTELLDLLRLGMNDDDAQAKAARLIDRIGNADMVVLDDVGAERPTEWVAERFYSIINGIWANRKRQTLIATSNKTLQGIEMTIGPRVRSRIDGLTITVEYKGGDKRRKSY